MIALLDSGNSRLHFSWWDSYKLKNPVSIPYPETPDALTGIVADLFSINIPQKVAACSVSSQWKEFLFRAVEKIAPGKLVVARTALDTGIRIKYDKPETLGIDRVLAVDAAYRFFCGSCVVIDAGTAVTVDAVGEDGTFLGGYIFPGADLLSRSLSAKTSLPCVSPDYDCTGVGNSTESCISRAVSLGFYAAVDKLIRLTAIAAGGTDRIIVTGGGGEHLMKCLPFTVVYRPFLVLEGLGYCIDRLPEYSE